VNNPTDAGLRRQSVTIAEFDAVVARMVTVPVAPTLVSVAIDIPLVFLAPSAFVTVVPVAIVVLPVPLMLLVVPWFVVMPMVTVVPIVGLQELFLVARG